MNPLRFSCSLVALIALAAITTDVGAQDHTAATGRFSGSLRGTSFGGAVDASKFSGSVDINPTTDGKAGFYKVEVRLSSSGGSASGRMTNMLPWTISPGRCGSRVQPLVQPMEVQPLELRSGGNAELTWTGQLPLAANGSYQFVVYDRGVREQDVVACGNLKYTKPKD
ncbi:MAG: hypothetical protein C0497_11000 [Gemmatimonas sp.]|nr:hypothetical protein [Gemmatimonas sp.]